MTNCADCPAVADRHLVAGTEAGAPSRESGFAKLEVQPSLKPRDFDVFKNTIHESTVNDEDLDELGLGEIPGLYVSRTNTSRRALVPRVRVANVVVDVRPLTRQVSDVELAGLDLLDGPVRDPPVLDVVRSHRDDMAPVQARIST
jgi:hypothetical protein